MKATTVLGSAQVVEALVALVRAKIVAIFLGPVGTGLNAMYQLTLNTINQFVSAGLPQSAVRDISKSNNAGNREELEEVVSIFVIVLRLFAFVGMLLCVGIAPLLSDFSFGKSDNHTYAYIFLSVGLLFMVLSSGNITIMQGTRQLNSLARSSIVGAIISLILSLPFFMFMGNDGIVVAIIVSYGSMFAVNSYFVYKLHLSIKCTYSIKRLFEMASPMVKLGVVIMLSNILVAIFTYITNVMIRHFGSITDVGFYQSAFSITNRNFAILSVVLVGDFYPRLSVVCNDVKLLNKTVSEQAELLILIVSAMSVVIIVFSSFIIRLLLSEEYLVIAPLLRLMSFALIFRVIWMVLSYIALANGDKRIYLVYDAVIGNGCYMLGNIICYNFWGIMGLGVSCVVGAIFVSVLFLIVYGIKYKFRFSKKFWRLFFTCSSSIFVFLIISNLNIKSMQYFVLLSFLLVSFYIYLFVMLNKRIDLINLIRKRS